jgi:formylglycine-generating enzyme required for sulfatase activity
VSITNTIGMKLVPIPPGKFLMGTPATEKGAKPGGPPPHEVSIAKSFYLGQHEVAVGQFRAFVQATGYQTEAESSGKGAGRFDAAAGKMGTWDPTITWRQPGFPQEDDHPVTCVTWNDAVAFCEWLTKKEGKRYRLPTEAEWEYACRAGTTTPFHFGKSLSSHLANCDGNRRYGIAPKGKGTWLQRTSRVGSYLASAWDLYDMHGNVWEWCSDDHAGNRAIRGGGWDHGAGMLRSASRLVISPMARTTSVGFRVACDP